MNASELQNARVARLNAEMRCPACGAKRNGATGGANSAGDFERIAVYYDCGAIFACETGDPITVVVACPGASYVAAAALEREATIGDLAPRVSDVLASDVRRAAKGSGEIRIKGNRYWDASLTRHAGQNVIIRLGADSMPPSVKVYTLEGVLICEASRIKEAGFSDVETARVANRERREFRHLVANSIPRRLP